MPTVTIYIADGGTKLANGTPSEYGHMWYSLNKGDGSGCIRSLWPESFNP